jgi:hypothetical protein
VFAPDPHKTTWTHMHNFMLQWIMGGRRSQHTPWVSDT